MFEAEDNFRITLQKIATLLDANNITWWIGASSALYVQGVNVIPKDLDIIVDVAQFQAAYDALVELRPGEYEEGDFAGEKYFKATLGSTPFPAEIAGFKPDGSELKRLKWQDISVVVHPLEVEVEMYRKRTGKEHIVALIEAALRQK